MKLPFLWLSAGLVAGILLEILFKPAPAIWIFSFVMLLPLLWAGRGHRIFYLLLLAVMIPAGALRSQLDSTRPPHAIENFANSSYWVRLKGEVDAMPEIKLKGKKKTVSLVLNAQEISFRSKNNFGRWQKTTGKLQVFLFQPSWMPETGEKILLWGKLEKPRLPLNPGQFNYSDYLAQSNIYALFTAYGPRGAVRLESSRQFFFFRMISFLQKTIDTQINRYFTGDQAILFKALTLGTRKGLSSELRDDFLKTGTSHLIAAQYRISFDRF